MQLELRLFFKHLISICVHSEKVWRFGLEGGADLAEEGHELWLKVQGRVSWTSSSSNKLDPCALRLLLIDWSPLLSQSDVSLMLSGPERKYTNLKQFGFVFSMKQMKTNEQGLNSHWNLPSNIRSVVACWVNQASVWLSKTDPRSAVTEPDAAQESGLFWVQWWELVILSIKLQSRTETSCVGMLKHQNNVSF